jgi:DNA-binding NarL/FixJ family response regulator
MRAPSFLIVDDHPLFLEALQSALEFGFPGAKVDVAETICSAREKLDSHQFSLVLLDLKMPDTNGFEGLVQIRNHCPRNPIAVISAVTGSDVVHKVKSFGADGFICKNQCKQNILDSVESLLSGAHCFPVAGDAPHSAAGPHADDVVGRLRQLTPQQFKVLTRVCEAKLNKQIAYELGVTETTIKAHVTLIFKKLGVHSRTQAVLLLQRIRTELEETEFGVLLSAQA